VQQNTDGDRRGGEILSADHFCGERGPAGMSGIRGKIWVTKEAEGTR